MSKDELRAITPRKMNAKEARQMLLSGVAPIIRDLIQRATGKPNEEAPGTYYNVDEKARQTVLNAIIPMLQQAGDIQKVSASSTVEILDCLKEGTVTFAEAVELMKLVQAQFEMTELRTLADRLDGIDPDAIGPKSANG